LKASTSAPPVKESGGKIETISAEQELIELENQRIPACHVRFSSRFWANNCACNSNVIIEVPR
jgi:hypothetical protein